MIKPTVGRVVWYHRSFVPDVPEPQPSAALVTFVHGDELVDLVVFDHRGGTTFPRSVPLRQEGSSAPEGHFCEWMPYQIGQAKKHAGDAA